MGDQSAIGRAKRNKVAQIELSSTSVETGKDFAGKALSPEIKYTEREQPGWYENRKARIHPAHLIFFGCICELLYVVIGVLSPLPGLHLSATPLPAVWHWTLWPSQWLFPSVWQGVQSVAAQRWQCSVLLCATFIALALTYFMAIRSIAGGQYNRLTNARWLYVLLGGAIIFGCTLLLQPMLFSDNVFTYIISGRMLAIYHADPLNHTPIQFALDPFLDWIGAAERNIPNMYGPLWLYTSAALASIKAAPVVTLLLFKLFALLSHLLNCLLVWLILDKIAPGRKLLGTLVYAWNPLVLIELAGNGQNEGLLLMLFLLATLIYVSEMGKWREVVVMALLGLAVSVNLVALLIAPLYAWFMVRRISNPFKAIWSMCSRLTVVVAITVLLYLPFWRGPSTFFAIMSILDIQQVVHSSIGLLGLPARWAFTQVDKVSQFPPVMRADSAADTTLRATAIFIFALIYFQLFSHIRKAPQTVSEMRSAPNADSALLCPGFDVLLDCIGCCIFWFLLLVLGNFWPWYALWMLWIVALRRFDSLSVALLVLTNTALLVYPLLMFDNAPFIMYRPLLIFGLPLIFLILSWKRQKERLALQS
jgi:hypothetical protein